MHGKRKNHMHGKRKGNMHHERKDNIHGKRKNTRSIKQMLLNKLCETRILR